MLSNGLYKLVLSMCAMEAWPLGTAGHMQVPVCARAWHYGLCACTMKAWGACSHACVASYTYACNGALAWDRWAMQPCSTCVSVRSVIYLHSPALCMHVQRRLL